jgi:arginine utilization protein RocB
LQNNWYQIVRDYTVRLVAIRSVNSTTGEVRVAEEVLGLLQSDGLERAYTEIGLNALPGDASGRRNAYAFLRGRSPRTLVLLGHIDTVDTADYGPLEPWALDPAGLAERQDALADLAPGLAEDLAAHPGDWMFGRGAADMKSGVAAIIAVMRYLAHLAREGKLLISVVLLATVDEENESAGIIQATHLLSRLRAQYHLDYVGGINTDYTTARYPGDPHRYIYAGTVGKLLPSLLVIGREAHVGIPFDGIDANLLAAELIRTFSMNIELCEGTGKQQTPPPVTLHASDLKTRYDVQLPFMAYFYLNVLTFSTEPGRLLAGLQRLAQETMDVVLRRIDRAERRWREAIDLPVQEKALQPRSGSVLTYAELCADLVQRFGQERFDAELERAWESCPPDLDARERALHIVRSMWRFSGKAGPAVVLYYSPPYYPSVAPTPGALLDAVNATAQAHPEFHLVVEDYYPYISDMSYLRLDAGTDISALTANFPNWQAEDKEEKPPHVGAYRLPLETIQEIGMPVFNLGPYGRGVHQSGEAVLMSYSFGVVPQLLCEIIERLGSS